MLPCNMEDIRISSITGGNMINLDTLRFGEIEIDEGNILTFNDGLPGIEECKRFVVLELEEGSPILWMQSVDRKEISLPVADSFQLNPDYVFDIGDSEIGILGLKGISDVRVLNVLVIPEKIDEMTANFAAPIVINTRTGQAMQIILPSGNYGVRTPVFHDICRVIKEGEINNAGTVKAAK